MEPIPVSDELAELGRAQVRTLLTFLLLTTAISLGSQLPAQHGASTRSVARVPVTLALVDTLSGENPFRIVRRADLQPHDVILLRPSADSAALSAAIRDLLSIRGVQGDTVRAGSSAALRVRRSPGGRRQPVPTIPWARDVMNDLRNSRPREVAGIGNVPAVQIWLSPQRGPKRQP